MEGSNLDHLTSPGEFEFVLSEEWMRIWQWVTKIWGFEVASDNEVVKVCHVWDSTIFLQADLARVM